jgi:hypothetical protein
MIYLYAERNVACVEDIQAFRDLSAKNDPSDPMSREFLPSKIKAPILVLAPPSCCPDQALAMPFCLREESLDVREIDLPNTRLSIKRDRVHR